MVYGQVVELGDVMAVLKVASVVVLMVDDLVVLLAEKMVHCAVAERVVQWVGDLAYTPDSELAELSVPL